MCSERCGVLKRVRDWIARIGVPLLRADLPSIKRGSAIRLRHVTRSVSEGVPGHSLAHAAGYIAAYPSQFETLASPAP